MFDARPQHNEYLRHRAQQFRQQVVGVLELRLAFAGKADDDIRVDRGVGKARADALNEGAIVSHGIAAFHRR